MINCPIEIQKEELNSASPILPQSIPIFRPKTKKVRRIITRPIIPSSPSFKKSTDSLAWVPISPPPYARSSHPLDVSCLLSDLHQLQTLSSLSHLQPFVQLSSNLEEQVTIKEFCQLISPFEEINQQAINLYLHLLSRQFDTKILDTSFYTTLQQQGWSRVNPWFCNHSSRRRVRPSTPALSGESSISFPCHVNGYHWVEVTRREVEGRVFFLCADDMNNPATEAQVRAIISSRDPLFFPETASWIPCHNYTYHPHSNECGINTMLALMIQALHPSPSPSILLPYMHTNQAQIGRSWIATCLLNSSIPQEPLEWIISQPQYPFRILHK